MTEEKLLIALVGGTAGDRPAGHMVEGFCVPLAATPLLLEVLGAHGEERVADVVRSQDGRPPPTGGLWVFECKAMEDDEQDFGVRLRNGHWRAPTIEELSALLHRQDARRRGTRPVPVTGTSRWVQDGALV